MKIHPQSRPSPICAGDTILDLGANVGSFARMAAPVLGQRGKIYCVEPIPDVYVALKRNAEVYQKWADRHRLPIAKIVPVHAGKNRLDAVDQTVMLVNCTWHTPSTRDAIFSCLVKVQWLLTTSGGMQSVSHPHWQFH